MSDLSVAGTEYYPDSVPRLFYGDLGRGNHNSLDMECRGIRVFYYDALDGKIITSSDHEHVHNEEWKKKLANRSTEIKYGSGSISEVNDTPDKMARPSSLEAGTIVAVLPYHREGSRTLKCVVVVLWDCGYEGIYKMDDFKKMRVFDLGPAGYKGEMVFCDKCLMPVMGFAWRLAKVSDSGDLYDLCCTHYNENRDPYPEGIIPSGNITSKSDREKIDSRSASLNTKCDLIGLFKGAKVMDNEESNRDQKCEGTILKIEHKHKYEAKDNDKNKGKNNDKDKEMNTAQRDMRKADFYNCYAEVLPKSDSYEPLQYRSVGAKGKVDISALTPGKWGEIYPSHHPILSMDLLYEMATYKSRLHKMKDAEYCFMRRGSNGKCYSLTISGTTLKEISDDSIWEECRDLDTVILLMNALEELPSGLRKFENTIKLVCIQDNCFSEVPIMLYQFKKLEHLNMHGNYLSSIPMDFGVFTELTRLYLGHNDIKCLPDIFDHFPKLVKASFTNNSLTRLPKTFSKLINLEKLDISHNSIVKFPQPLLRLENLKHLNLKWNKLQKLAPSKCKDLALFESTLSFLKQLSYMELKGNLVWKHIICSRLGNEKPDNKHILQELRKDEVFEELCSISLARSLRINVLGKSEAGKTSVVQALCKDRYVIPTTNEKHRHTVGIDRYYLPFDMGDKIIQLNIWDHAGDNEYAMMNDLFISRRSLVWIVVDLYEYSKNGIKDVSHDHPTFKDMIGEWLRQVMSHNIKPIICIIGTHSDMCTSTGVHEAVHIEKCIDLLCKELEKRMSEKISNLQSLECSPDSQESKKLNKMRECLGAPKFLKENKKIFVVTNTYGFLGLKKLSEYLHDLPTQHDGLFQHLMDCLPVEWEEKINTLCSHSETAECSTQFLPTVTVGDSKRISPCRQDFEVLNYCHEIGEIYIMSALTDKYTDGVSIILDVDQLINLLKKVYHHESFEDQAIADTRYDEKVLADSDKKERGTISRKFLKRIWNCCTESESDQRLFNRIIELFENFDLIYVHQRETDPFYFFPYLLKDSEFEDRDACFEKARTLIVMKFEFGYLPKFFLQRLALKSAGQNDDLKIYKNGFGGKIVHGIVKLHVIKKSKSIQAVASSHEVMKADALWKVMVDIMLHMHDLLLHWQFHGTLELFVMCPNCKANRISLKSIELSDFGSMMLCKNCNRHISLEEMTLPYDMRSQLENCNEFVVSNCGNLDHFTRYLPEKDWILTKTAQATSSAALFSVSDFSSADQFIPSEECTDNVPKQS